MSGSDQVYGEQVERLERAGIRVQIGGIAKEIEDADLVIASAAIKEDDPEFCHAKKLGKKIISRAEALGLLASSYENVISVAGSHGKTTTTGMIAKIFIDANEDPTVHIGGNLPEIGGNVREGSSKFFITEACEYVDSFLELSSDVSIILNIQKDHLDYFKTFSNINKSFTKFAKNTKKGGLVVFNGDDVHANKKYQEKSISFSLEDNGILCAKNIHEYENGKFAFDCFFLGSKFGEIKLGVYGKHNISNSLSAIATALYYGISFDQISKSLFDFQGVKRRFQDYGELFGTKLIHDYAHHPTEIKATIEVAKKITKGDVFVVFQPHTYSRTKLLLPEFKKCFAGAKEVFVFKVYSAREKPSAGVDEKVLASELCKQNIKATAFDDYSQMLKFIFPKLKPNDTLLVLGAGDIENFLPFVNGRYQNFCEQK